jgi:hypothetical protein
MDLALRSAGLVRALIYPVQFERNPVDAVDRVLEMVVRTGCLDGTPVEYLNAISEALASTEQLADLIPQDHSEEAIRRFLAKVARRIKSQVGP